VTGAVWTNIAGDAKQELVVVGEWMTPRIFSYTQNTFTEIKTNLNGLNGMWQSVKAADLDGDGKEDLVLGNLGENAYLQPAATTPVKMWVADYDNNGTAEKIITRTVKGKDVPVFLKKDIVDQIASLRKQNLNYEVYATKSIQGLFPESVLNRSELKVLTHSSSCIAFNDGNGSFTIKKLPPYAQFSSINALLCTDINSDGKTDIIAGGNAFEFQPQFSRLDASYGHILINKGSRDFECLLPDASGLELRGQIRDIVALPAKGKEYLLFLQNDDYPVLYKKAKKKPNNLKTP
jgi:hypothetical protein